jgi:hypothetical protein
MLDTCAATKNSNCLNACIGGRGIASQTDNPEEMAEDA